MAFRITMSDLTRRLRAATLILPFLTGAAIAAAEQEGAASPPPTISADQRIAWFIRGGCPYNLDKECHRTRRGRVACRCVS